MRCGLPRQRDFTVVWFSRGRGWGHAIPDIHVAREVLLQRPEIRICFISYAAGAAAFRERDFHVIDLRLPSDPPFFEVLVRSAKIIGNLRPRLLVAHEEVAAVVAGAIYEIPCLFITDFFQDPTSPLMTALLYASEVIFTGQPGIFTEPPYLREKIHYVGPVVPEARYKRRDRVRARKELGLPADAVVVLCLPGSWTERAFPTAELIAGAWEKLPYASKYLVWVSGDHQQHHRGKFPNRSGVFALKPGRRIDRLLVASDVVITKGTRQTLYEAASLGAPCISISAGLNWPDDVVAVRIPGNTLVALEVVTAQDLAELIRQKVSEGWAPEESLPAWQGGTLAAQMIVKVVDRLRRS